MPPDALLSCVPPKRPPPHPCLRCLPVPPLAGETEEQHRELVDFCTNFKFERMGCFQYSAEDGTPAAELPEQVGHLFWAVKGWFAASSAAWRMEHTPESCRSSWRERFGYCEGACGYVANQRPEPSAAAAAAALQIEDEVRESRRDELVSLQQRLGEGWAKTRVGQEVRTGAHCSSGWGRQELGSCSWASWSLAEPLKLARILLTAPCCGCGSAAKADGGLQAAHCAACTWYVCTHPTRLVRCTLLQIDVLVDGHTEDGELYGRSQWDAPDIDPIVFLLQPEEGSGARAGRVGLGLGLGRGHRLNCMCLLKLEEGAVNVPEEGCTM